MSKCKECGAEIVFIKNPATGKMVPVDARLYAFNISLDGPSRAYLFPSDEPTRGRFDDIDDRSSVHVRVSHFTTCTNPKRFSKKAKKP